MSVLWLGTTDVTQRPDSPRIRDTASRNEISLVYEGPYSGVLSVKPQVGVSLSTFDAYYTGYIIEQVEVVKEPGTKGVMTVTGVIESPDLTGTTQNPDPTYEIEWMQLEKKLHQNDVFRIGNGGTYELTEAQYNALVEWENDTDKTTKAAKYAALSANALVLALKITKGIESYLFFVPVARKTSYSYIAPTTSNAGKRETPTGFLTLPTKPSGGAYSWLKTADRGVRQGRRGRWERVEEWTGADIWDTDLYPLA